MRKFAVSIWRLVTGADGALSWSKVSTIWVAFMYTTRRPIPEMIATIIILASHGTKVLMEWLSKRPLKETTVTEVTKGGSSTEVTTTTEKLPPSKLAAAEMPVGPDTVIPSEAPSPMPPEARETVSADEIP